MEIFSDGEERIYCISMTYEDLFFFSEFQKEFGNKANKLARRMRETGLNAEELAQYDKYQRLTNSFDISNRDKLEKEVYGNRKPGSAEIREKFITANINARISRNETHGWNPKNATRPQDVLGTQTLSERKSKFRSRKLKETLNELNTEIHKIIENQEKVPEKINKLRSSITPPAEVKKSISKNKKLALGIGAGVAAAGTAGYYLSRRNKKKENK